LSGVGKQLAINMLLHALANEVKLNASGILHLDCPCGDFSL
jgi:hypothetical protein|tara:strand:- start:659 stop:781 length:123 start_codon:yes stop_codon:yes gene_type:complete